MKWDLASSKTWAIDEESVNQVGCIHTYQGLEFDYIGLMTRAMKGCYIYCTDKGLSKYLKEKLNETMENLKHKDIEVNILA